MDEKNTVTLSLAYYERLKSTMDSRIEFLETWAKDLEEKEGKIKYTKEKITIDCKSENGFYSTLIYPREEVLQEIYTTNDEVIKKILVKYDKFLAEERETIKQMNVWGFLKWKKKQ